MLEQNQHFSKRIAAACTPVAVEPLGCDQAATKAVQGSAAACKLLKPLYGANVTQVNEIRGT